MVLHMSTPLACPLFIFAVYIISLLSVPTSDRVFEEISLDGAAKYTNQVLNMCMSVWENMAETKPEDFQLFTSHVFRHGTGED